VSSTHCLAVEFDDVAVGILTRGSRLRPAQFFHDGLQPQPVFQRRRFALPEPVRHDLFSDSHLSRKLLLTAAPGLTPSQEFIHQAVNFVRWCHQEQESI
jgi:hypothetical protein